MATAAKQQLFIVNPGQFSDASNWISNKGDHINKPASVDFRAAQHADGTMVVSNALDQNYGGALVSYTTSPLPRVDGKLLRYLAYHLKCKFSKATYYNLARHEIDLKVCVKTRPDAQTKIRNVANFSTQWNTETGEYQIDKDPPEWVGTGYFVDAATVDPDEWHSLDYRFHFDEDAELFSVLSIAFDGDKYDIPEEKQNIAMSLTNWEECAKRQIQNEGLMPGAVVIQYDDGVLIWSDQPISTPWEGVSRT